MTLQVPVEDAEMTDPLRVHPADPAEVSEYEKLPVPFPPEASSASDEPYSKVAELNDSEDCANAFTVTSPDV